MENIAEILASHAAWLRGESNGKRANLSRANLSRANLSRANLSRADLSGANLSGANLSGAYLSEGVTSDRAPIQLHGFAFSVLIWDGYMQIGCQFHSIASWRESTNDAIARMGGEVAAQQWDRMKSTIFAMIEADGRA